MRKQRMVRSEKAFQQRIVMCGLALMAAAFGITSVLPAADPARERSSLKVATFNVDATPPIGSPVAYVPARTIEDPLFARGIVLLGAGQPIVLCAVDWLGIGNAGHDLWRERLAQAAGTTTERVAVHTLHQHDAPRCDFRAEELLAEEGFGGRRYDAAFARAAIEKVASAIERSLPQAQPVTHVGVGTALVEKVASNRRILGPDGKVKIMRFSKSTNAEAIAAPEGVIDPSLRAISLWNGERPLVSMTYYATHPQSYYGDGDVTSDFVGLARAQREAELPEVFHVHFNGAGGNVAAGKYNDGSPEMRPILAGRLAEGMKRAWNETVRQPIGAADVEWRIEAVSLPVAAHLEVDKLRKAISAPEGTISERLNGARKLAWLQRNRGGQTIDVSCLKLKDVSILHLPGELFVEYQLAAQQMRPLDVVCMAAYGDYGPGYIGTEIAYSQGGYETSHRASNVAPNVEHVLMQAMRKLLK